MATPFRRRPGMLATALLLTAGIVLLRRLRQNGPNHRSEHAAKVVGFSPDGTVLVRLDDGRAIHLPLVEGIRDRCEVGSAVLVYFDEGGEPLAWYLPDAGTGVVMIRK
jgi:hypothetical protein